MILTNLFAIYAASWDLLSGHTGQFSFGHAFLFGGGAYIYTLLNLELGLSPPLCIIIASLGGLGLGMMMFLPSTRLRGRQLAIATFAFPLALMGILSIFPKITGGTRGLTGVAPLFQSLNEYYYLTLLLLFVSVYIIWKITKTNFGVVLLGIREKPDLTEMSGIHVNKYKLYVFFISGLFAGMSGALYASFMKIVGPGILGMYQNFYPIMWSAFGGMGTIIGPVGGVFALYFFLEFARIAGGARILLLALVLLIVYRWKPEGIFRWAHEEIMG